MFYSLSNKIASQHKQLIVLTHQNLSSKATINKTNNISMNSLLVKYTLPPFKKAMVVQKCNLNISPLENSNILSTIESNTNLDLLDSAEIMGLTWYEVSIPANDRINNKGWIKSSNVNILDEGENGQ